MAALCHLCHWADALCEAVAGRNRLLTLSEAGNLSDVDSIGNNGISYVEFAIFD